MSWAPLVANESSSLDGVEDERIQPIDLSAVGFHIPSNGYVRGNDSKEREMSRILC